MAHMIDQTTGRNAIAYVGETPWHGLGQSLTQGADIETWRREAGLAFDVVSAPVQYMNGEMHTFKGRNVLYRNDTNAPLSVVSDKYRIVQPAEVLSFFDKLVKSAGFTLETAGVIDGGKKVWGLAKVHDGAPVIGHDVVRPYVLLATSFDGSLSTTGKFTAVRVVCNNTLTMSAGGGGMANTGQTEVDKTQGAVVQSVRITHSERFDGEAVRQQLGIVVNAFDRFLVESRLLAETRLTAKDADSLTFDLVAPTINPPKGQPLPDIRLTRSYKRIMELFCGGSIGYDLSGGANAWGWVNAVTQLVDHERGRSDSTRMNSAWFGTGETLKNRAFEMALAL